MKEIGIYIHIPFCAKKCNYCDFISFENMKPRENEYIQALKKEIVENKNSQYIVNTIYIGGGTPSYINSKSIIEIINTIKGNYEINKNAEITIEVNPGTVNKEKLEDYINVGINRISIGLQSTSNKILKTIGRIHTYEQFLENYKLAQEVGFKNINVDLMLALPNQTIKDLEDSVEKIINLNPNHISIYSLILEEETKMYNDVMAGKYVLPEDDFERKMYWLVKNKLERSGYIHYEISNYAKKGYESKHNSDCWEQKEYLGFGIAAHSYFNKKRYSNTTNINEYIEKYKKYIKLEENQNKEDEQKEYMMLGLRKIEGVNIQKFKNKFMENPLYLYKNEIEKLVNEGLLEVDLNNIKLTKKGIDLANLVWEEFVWKLEYLYIKWYNFQS